MADSTLCSLHFWRIFSAFLRKGVNPEENDRANAALVWATDNISILKAVCLDAETELLGVVWNYWLDYHQAPSYSIVEDLVQKIDKNEGILESLNEFKDLQEELPKYDFQDLPQILADKRSEFELGRFNAIIERSKTIANFGIEEKKTKKKLIGPEEAVTYFLKYIQNGLVSSRRTVGGELNEVAKEIKAEYEIYKQENTQNKLIIRTMLNKLDQVIGGLKRGTFWGILGFAGNRKSTLARTLLYNAAQQGFNCLHIPLEQTYEEERNIYAILHSHQAKFLEYGLNLTKTAFENGSFTPEEEKFFFGTVIPDLENNIPGSIIIRQPSDFTWPTIKATIELQNQLKPIDLVLIDYLTLIDTLGAFNEKEYLNNVIKEVKNWGMSFDRNRGLAILTPVQGNREGYDYASKNEGKWTMAGVYQYSEFDKSLDGCISVYTDEELSDLNQIRIGTAKVRRSKPVPPFLASVCPSSGMIRNLDSATIDLAKLVESM